MCTIHLLSASQSVILAANQKEGLRRTLEGKNSIPAQVKTSPICPERWVAMPFLYPFFFPLSHSYSFVGFCMIGPLLGDTINHNAA
ncbi:hypothetical protein NQ318_008722 [Aromia moschata]|uniref:Uncharacterized protein n=1 Tax=Aromia moschata TaxID=1265417 RepID=A0AAV8XBB0_9CUCU|nr:hypothetical protein NQ318_008722 [Aromia moschata]